MFAQKLSPQWSWKFKIYVFKIDWTPYYEKLYWDLVFTILPNVILLISLIFMWLYLLFQGLSFRKGTHQLFSSSHDRSVKIWNVDDRTYIETLYVLTILYSVYAFEDFLYWINTFENYSDIYNTKKLRCL